MSQEPQGILTVSRPHGKAGMRELLPELLAASAKLGKNPVEIALRYARVAAGPGKLAPEDFLELRLFDEAMYPGADLREFVGERQYRKLWYGINYRHDRFGILGNKIASVGYLKEYGLPTIPVKAIYAPGITKGAATILSDVAAIEHFLQHRDQYPLFGKPAESLNSLGSIGLLEFAPGGKEAVATDGRRVNIAQLASEIVANYADGYLFQELATPHRSIAELCSAKRLPTVRFVTIVTENGPEIFRILWKIPAGANMADNYWRSGNLLALVDDHGRIERVFSGKGFETQQLSVHPDTKKQLVGFVHPLWNDMQALALEGAQLMHSVPLIGWDVACTDRGPIIVEMNEFPDPFLMQFGQRCGILDDTFKKFAAYQKKNRDAFQAEMKRRLANP